VHFISGEAVQKSTGTVDGVSAKSGFGWVFEDLIGGDDSQTFAFTMFLLTRD
jgi:hypothetical protein